MSPPPPKFGSEKYTPFLRSTPPPRRWQVTVNIERTSMNSRRISGSIVINRPIEVSTPVCVVEEECYYCCCCCCVVAIKGSTILALRCEGRQAVRGCAMWKRWYYLCVCSARVFLSGLFGNSTDRCLVWPFLNAVDDHKREDGVAAEDFRTGKEFRGVH